MVEILMGQFLTNCAKGPQPDRYTLQFVKSVSVVRVIFKNLEGLEPPPSPNDATPKNSSRYRRAAFNAIDSQCVFERSKCLLPVVEHCFRVQVEKEAIAKYS